MRLGRVFDIDVGLDSSWFFIFLLVTLSLAQLLAVSHPDLTAAYRWPGAIVCSLAFFGSIVLHELGHSLTSNALGIRVRSITLFIFGGLASLSGEPRRPRDEFLIAIMGPVVSVLLGGLFLGLASAIGEQAIGGMPATLLGWLGKINLILAVFNLVPGFPLDGGRVFRSLAWALSGDFRRATVLAGHVGIGFAYSLIALGILIGFGTGNLFSGLWLAFIGWFLMTAARGSTTQVLIKDQLLAIPVGSVMDTSPCVVDGSRTVAELVREPLLLRGQRTFLVAHEGELEGLVTLQEIRPLGEARRETTLVRDIAVPRERLVTITPTCSTWEAMQIMDGHSINQLPVLDGRHLLGILTREGLMRVVRTQLELSPPSALLARAAREDVQ